MPSSIPASASTEPPVTRRLVFVHAHPDDETLTTGGTMARYAAEPGTTVTLVTCTLGEEGEVIPPMLAGLASDRADQLGGYRLGELAEACDALGVTDRILLGGVGRWRDSGMARSGHGVRAATPAHLHPRAFAVPTAFGAQVDALVEVLVDIRPQVVVTYAADGGYGHPDHVRAHEITVAAVAQVPARLLFTVTGRAALDAGIARMGRSPFHRPAPDELPSVDDATITTRLDVTPQRERRIAAMRAHTTQIHVGGTAGETVYAMSNGVAQPLLDVEEFVAADGRPSAGLFADEPVAAFGG